MTKIIVTDPCYYIPDTRWGEAIKRGKDLNDPKGMKIFLDYINEFFNDFEIPSVTANTGVGDWINQMDEFDDRIEINSHAFCADSGTVSAFVLTDKLLKDENFMKEYVMQPPFTTAEITIPDDIKVKLEADTSDPSWTIINVIDADTGEILASSMLDDYVDQEEE